MKIGLLSDTHGFLDDKVFQYFESCDEIWHAGDIGTMEVVRALREFKPLRAVYGNIDDKTIRAHFPEDLFFRCEGLNIMITHIAGTPPKYNSRVRALLKEKTPDMLICGHSHVLQVKRDAAFNNLLYINPGAAGQQGFHRVKTLVRFDIWKAELANMEVIELGKRGAL